ncbi:MAG: 7-carboxy-7-deazaguanine synthase QueE [Gammaproteobacteria bacterium]|nr:7-carboxy-7-deazaguanine synthase QueE [Gammaproteobacteria bacterium]
MKNSNNTYVYSEIFDSVQGEGHYAGFPSAWLRLFLCNLQCNGFGQDDPTDPSTYKLPYKDFDAVELNRLEELPVWEYGCDSSYSWSKKFKHLQHRKTSREIADLVRAEFANEWNGGKWLDRHMCFTGGEPLMKHAQLCTMEIMRHWFDDEDYPLFVTYESNGTQIPGPEFIDFWKDARDRMGVELFISCSPKLWNVAGETTRKAIKPETVARYLDFSSNGQLKFVVNGSQACWDELDSTIARFRQAGVDWPIWIMPVGATVEGQKLLDGDVARMAYQRGYKVSARVHTYLWGNLIGV